MGYSNLFVVVIWGIQHGSFLHWTTILLRASTAVEQKI